MSAVGLTFRPHRAASLCVAILMSGMLLACAGPGIGSLLPNSYIAPTPSEPTVTITFRGTSDDPNVTGHLVFQASGPFTPSGRRQIVMIAGPQGLDGIPANGFYNTISNTYDEEARTITFSAARTLYFSTETSDGPSMIYGSGGTYYCIVGFSFTPESGKAYAAEVQHIGERCRVELTDIATGRPEPSLRMYDPPRR